MRVKEGSKGERLMAGRQRTLSPDLPVYNLKYFAFSFFFTNFIYILAFCAPKICKGIFMS